MSEEEERKRQEDRRAWLGDPIEHGGGYRPPKTSWAPDIGCCAVEALGSVSFLAGLAALSFHYLLP